MLRTFCRRTASLASSRRQIVHVSSCSTWAHPKESADDFRHVERILPAGVVPEPPQHASYPTPSGWFPATATWHQHPYYVQRTRNHQMPVYLEIRNGGTRKLTVVCKVNGDIWAFEKDLAEYLTELEGKKAYTSVDELCLKVWVRGAKMRVVADFLTMKGF